MINPTRSAFGVALSRRGLFCGAAALAGLSLIPGSTSAAAQSSAQPYALSDFFHPDQVRAAVLSPSGQRIAVLEQVGTGDASRGMIDIIDANDPEGPRRRIELGDLEVETVDWASDQRLLVRVLVTHTGGAGVRTGSNFRSEEIEFQTRRILSVDAQTGGAVMLFQGQRRSRLSLDLGAVIDLLPEDPDHILMATWESDGVLGLHRVNVNDGSSDLMERGNPNTFMWQTQNGVPVLRHDINARGNMETLFARAPGEDNWRFVRRTRFLDSPDFAWVGETDRPGVVLVRARAEGEDVEAVREMDLRTLTLGAPIHSRPDRDVLYGLRDSQGRYLGAAYYGQRLEYQFTEAGLDAHHRALNRFFEDDCDVYLTEVDAARNRFVAYAVGPREPGSWYFYDRQARAVVPLGARRLFDMQRLAGMETLSVTTRDGATIEAYLSAPVGARPGPLVVLPHGGPAVRDHRAWDTQVQALASQGWWVLQPNFRGSGGYGEAFERQGWTRWGDRMQEDVEDAVEVALTTKGLDRDRVAIMGTSYGGYAALMGAVRRPELYKAAISICGVGDLPEMLAWERREDDTPGQPIYQIWRDRIGDPETQGALLQAASPRRRAAEIACPVLLVHGADDPVVPAIQSRRMREALRDARKQVEYIEVEDAGHADWERDKEGELMGRYVALLRQAFA